ncbi:hypothetical protein LINPERPRIM_LOCUS4209, partial [Linum perenne]
VKDRNWTVDNSMEFGIQMWMRNRRDGNPRATYQFKVDANFSVHRHGRTGDGSLMLMQIMKILSKRFTLQRSDYPVPSSADDAYEEYDDLDRSSDNIPADVKEGHFVVYAVNDAEPRRSGATKQSYRRLGIVSVPVVAITDGLACWRSHQSSRRQIFSPARSSGDFLGRWIRGRGGGSVVGGGEGKVRKEERLLGS